jgi:hypothetical protein
MPRFSFCLKFQRVSSEEWLLPLDTSGVGISSNFIDPEHSSSWESEGHEGTERDVTDLIRERTVLTRYLTVSSWISGAEAESPVYRPNHPSLG